MDGGEWYGVCNSAGFDSDQFSNEMNKSILCAKAIMFFCNSNKIIGFKRIKQRMAG